MKKTYYTNIQKKKLCNRNNGELKTLPRFDFQMEDYFSVIFVDSLNKIIEIDPTDQFYIAGGLDVMKNSENLLFYSEDFTLDNNRLTFTIDTYTDNYLKHIKNTNTPIYLEIGILNEKKTILLQDIVLAEPRVYLDGVAPTKIEVYYTKAQIDEKFQYIEEVTTNNLIDYVNEQNYIKTIDGTQADDEGNFDLSNFGYISVNNIGGYTGFKNIQEITAGEYIQVYDFNSLAAAYYITNIEQNIALFPEFNFHGLTEKQIKTIQVWVKNEVTLSVLELPDNYTVIDPDNFPTKLQVGTTSVFVIRLYYNGSQLNTIINYAYSFAE